MNLAGLAWRNLRRRPIRTALSILGIALAVGSALALLALSRSIQDATRDGMDEISLGASTLVGELKDGEIREYELHPEDFGFAMSRATPRHA